MTNQEALNKVAAHLKAQGCASIRAVGGAKLCAYAGENDTACGVGSLLPRNIAERLDRLFDTSWEGVLSSADDGDQAAIEAALWLQGVDTDLLVDLQSAHDNCDSATDFWSVASIGLRDVAHKFHLTLPPELR